MEYVLLIRLALFLLYYILTLSFFLLILHKYYFLGHILCSKIFKYIYYILLWKFYFMQNSHDLHEFHKQHKREQWKKVQKMGKLCFWTHLNNHVNDIFCHVYIRQMFVKFFSLSMVAEYGSNSVENEQENIKAQTIICMKRHHHTLFR